MNQYFFKQKRLLVCYFLISILTYACLTFVFRAYSWITEITEEMNLTKAYQITLFCVIILLTLLILILILAVAKRYILYEISIKLRKDIFARVYDMEISEYNKENTSYYSSLLFNDVSILEDNYYTNVLELIGDSVQLVIMLLSICLIGYQYMFIIILFAIPSVIQPFIMKKKLGRHGLLVSDKLSSYTNKVKEYVYAFELIKTFQREALIKKFFLKEVQKLEKIKRNQNICKAVNMCLVISAVYLIKIGSQLFFTYSSIMGAISVAMVTLLFGLANNVGNPIASILSYFTAINSTNDIRDKISIFITNDNESIQNDLTVKILEEFTHSIRLEHVGIAFGDKIVLKDITATFQKGKHYALMGESGSGKSTLLKLIMGYYSEYKGSIHLDKTELKELKLKSIWSRIAYIHQNVFVMEGTVRENITLFKEYSDDKIQLAIEAAGLKDLINSLPDGLDSIISEGGKNFSGGEKQRIAIARAYIADADILLIDEGSSALDNITAVNIEKTLLGFKDKTIISIIHRTNETIFMYDKIYVLKNGYIAQEGTYEELKNISAIAVEYPEEIGGEVHA